METLLQQRKTLKAKKPTFMRQDAHKKVKLKNNWRRPKGSDSKMRVSRHGYRRSVRIGWGSPSEVKGLASSGLRPVMVENVSQLSSLDPKKDCVVLVSSVGTKKRIMVIEAALKKGLKFMNIKDPAKCVDDLKKAFQDKKQKSDSKRKERTEKKEKVKKEAEKAKKKEEEKASVKKDASDEKDAPLTEEEKKLEEKKEKDKVLIQRQ